MKSKDSEKGFTLIEGIVAIAIAAISLVLVFSLLTLSLDLNIRSRLLLADSAKVNSLADHLRDKKSAGWDDQAIEDFLDQEYPEFSLVSSSQAGPDDLVMLELVGKDKPYYIVYWGGKDE